MMRVLLLLTGLLLPLGTAAHQLQTLSLVLDEQDDGRVQASLKVSLGVKGLPGNLLPVLTPACSSPGPGRVDYVGSDMLRQWTLQCDGGLQARRLRIEGLGPSLPDAVVTVRFASGEDQVAMLDLRQPGVLLGAGKAADTAHTLGGYFPIGIMHILGGADHLLFVFCLMLAVRAGQGGWRRLLAVITAFTLAHSLTLSLSMLTGLRLPAAAVEACIALSILLLAAELARHRLRAAEAPGLTLRHPALMAFLFGLLHGFGFASALSAIGLPPQAQGWALLLFNLGVEAGQLAFVGAVLFAAWLLLRLPPLMPYIRHGEKPVPVYMTTLLGVLSAYWFIGRLLPVLQG